jgi:hypothetical protein
MRAVSILALILVVAASGCGGEQASVNAGASVPGGWREHADERRGFSVSLPPGWHLAEQSPAAMGGDPVEILLAATFPLEESPGLCRPLAQIPPDQAIVSLMERGRGAFGDPTFPPRPASFEADPDLPGSSTWPYCLGGDHAPPVPMLDYWFGFSDSGRAFHVFVGVGKEAPSELTREAFSIFDTLRFDPDVKPDWRSVG